MHRRRFLQCLTAAAAAPALPAAAGSKGKLLGPLRADPQGIIDLPAGFSYRIVSRAGDRMQDGLRVPQAHDGMAAFAGRDGRIVLVCNHELEAGQIERSAFGNNLDALPDTVWSSMYDAGDHRTPAPGGTTTSVYNPATGITERQFLSLAGTENNCAGGATPWGSWLSCEECFTNPGSWFGRHREKAHGYVFEVAASATAAVQPRPIRAMGRFEHEAAAVHAETGIVYLTEDKDDSLFYRYLPEEAGNLLRGGRLQALAVLGEASFNTSNWSSTSRIATGESWHTHWIDLDNVDSDEDDLRKRGRAAGAATFARGEGLCNAADYLVFTCTTGGAQRLGQIFSYQPSAYEGLPRESETPGQLALLAESDVSSLLRNGDNIAFAPWGDLLVCEDTATHCGIVGVRADGIQYEIADNAYSNSELAGVCFSPDGKTLFVNIQYPGMTLAITGPWPAA